MKQFKFYIPAFLIIALILVISTASQKQPLEQVHIPGTNNEGFAVMELFTSQGCSSCPRADNLLGKYAALDDEHIIPLAFHVDYWNRLGWTDSFSSAKFSRRQRDYAMIIDHSSVYTPQLVINGEKEFIGSDAGKIADAVSNAIKAQSAVTIGINKIEKKAAAISISYTLDKVLKKTVINAVLLQKQVITNILKGENRGLKLINCNVARDFNSKAVNNISSFIDLQIPVGFNNNDYKVALYIQDDASGKIIGAIQKKL